MSAAVAWSPSSTETGSPEAGAREHEDQHRHDGEHHQHAGEARSDVAKRNMSPDQREN